MEISHITHLLATNADRVAALVAGLSAEQASWKPDLDTWSVLEVLGHMLDEERLDFRFRLDYVLNRPGEQFPPNDPGRWPVEHGYLDRDPFDTLEDFLVERRKSIEWLQSLGEQDWETAYAAHWGSIKAGDFLVSWPAHDLLHIRQIVEVLWALTSHLSSPYATEYAGEW